MDWECDCRQQEMFAVCHHCGKPLCETHGVVIADDAFGAGILPAGRAVHCLACKEQYHPRAQDLRAAGVVRRD
jgi:hypothetical protein